MSDKKNDSTPELTQEDTAKPKNKRRQFLEKAGLVAGGLLILDATGIAQPLAADGSTVPLDKLLGKALNGTQLGKLPSRLKTLTPAQLGALSRGAGSNGITLGDVKALTDVITERFGSNFVIKFNASDEGSGCCSSFSCCCCSQTS